MPVRLFFPDNTVLVNFGHINRLPLLGTLLGNRLAWCQIVADECAASARVPGLSSLNYAGQIMGPPWIPTPTEQSDTLDIRDTMRRPGDSVHAHLGEAETIAIITARQTPAYFVTDDGGARTAAQAAGISCLTTWDLLRACHQAGHLSATDAHQDAVALKNLGRGWPPCGPSQAHFTAWIS